MVGGSGWSAQTFTFLVVDAPTPPLELEIVAYDDSYVSFKWQRPLSSGGQPASGFKVYREDCSLAATSVDLLATVPAS